MKNLQLIQIALILLFSNLATAQNDNSFFKTIPTLDASTPEWAKKMYSDNPNVKEIDWAYYQFYKEHAFEKNIHTQNYKFWRRNIDSYIDHNGFIDQSLIQKEKTFLKYKQRQREQNTSARTSNWECIGPMETYNLGSQGAFPVSWQANVYSFDQSVSNPNILFAGMESGGLFKSTDKGLNWNLVSSNQPFITVSDVKIAPSNSEIVYVIAQSSIYKSINGGTDWDEVFAIGSNGFNLAIHPSNPDIVFCATENGLLKTTDGGVNWTNSFSTKCWDIAFHPANPDILYLLKTNPSLKKCEFFKSTDGGNSWVLKDNGWYVPNDLANANDIGARIAVTPAEAGKVVVGLLGESKASDNGFIGVYTSSDSGESWLNPNLPDGGPYNNNSHQNLATINLDGTGFHQGFYNFGIAVSHNNPNTIWVGCLSLSVSYDGGASWTRIGSYSAGNNDIGWIHPDIQDLHVLGDDIWVCTDGGINYSTDELQTHESRKNGLSGSNFWGFDQGWNEDILVGGRYHNGNTGYFQTYGEGNHLRLGGAEAATGYVNPLEERKAYFSDISTTILPDNLGGDHAYLSKIALYPNEHYLQSYSSEIVFDPRYAHHLFLGNENKIWKSENEGGLFEVLYDFGTAGRILEIEISRSNHNVMYCVFQNGDSYWDDCEIYRSNNGGSGWFPITNIPANRWRLEISLNPEDENELWVAAISGADGQKIYRTLNGGDQWDNMTSSVLNGEELEDILYQAGTDGLIYLVSKTGVFTRDNNSSDWEYCGDGLPLQNGSFEVKPFYRDSKLRMATLRGIWESDLVQPSMPIAQPMTTGDKSYCLRDTVPFDCYSILDHNGANWEWAFDPSPAYVSSLSARNPKVVFDTEGSYDVTLTVTDGSGNTSSKTVADMVTVFNFCQADTIPGKALECMVDGDFAETGNFDLNTTELSFTAWIKPNGIQNAYTGILMNNNTAAGLNFRDNNELGYHWPGGQWWWNSGLIAPEGEWSHVALVATAGSVAVYLNGVGSTHNIAIEPVDINTMLMGSYQGWGGRNYNGQIDEICIWKRALSQEEIRAYRHLTKENLIETDPDIIAYYQFNEEEGSILDKVGTSHASLKGNATRVTSSAPLGGGTSDRQDVTTGGSYNFENTGFVLDILDTGITPNGEVVVSRINLDPFNKPNQNPGFDNYWIVNNYGNNNIATSFGGVSFSPFTGFATGEAINDPSIAILFQREENGFIQNWEQLCPAYEVIGGTESAFHFKDNCNLNALNQFYISSVDEETPIVADDDITATKLVGKEAAQMVTIFPNPVHHNDDLIIDNKSDERIRLKLFNTNGKQVKDVFISKNEKTTLKINALSAGAYFYLLEGESFMKSGKLVVE